MSVVAYKNLFTTTGVTVTASTEAVGFEKENAYDYKQYDWWKLTTVGDNWIKLSSSVNKTADYVAIWGHDLFTKSTSYKIQYSDDDAIWVDASTATIPSDNKTIYKEFASSSHKFWRLLFNIAQNLLLYSEDFSQAEWTKSAFGSIIYNAETSPSGELDAVLIDNSASAFTYNVEQDIAIADDSSSRTLSFHVKEGTALTTDIALTFTGGTTVFASCTITWATHTVSAGTIEALADGWYRISITATNNSTGNTTATSEIIVPPSVTTYFWGAQLEDGATVNRYGRTEASTDLLPSIGGVQIGETTTLETGLQAGLAIPSISPMIENKTAMSELGVNLGATIKRTGVKGSIQLNNMTPAWARSDLEPFIDHLNNGYPAVFAWDSVNYPNETLLIWKTDAIPAPTYTSPLWMSANIPFEGVE